MDRCDRGNLQCPSDLKRNRRHPFGLGVYQLRAEFPCQSFKRGFDARLLKVIRSGSQPTARKTRISRHGKSVESLLEQVGVYGAPRPLRSPAVDKRWERRATDE